MVFTECGILTSPGEVGMGWGLSFPLKLGCFSWVYGLGLVVNEIGFGLSEVKGQRFSSPFSFSDYIRRLSF